ncbi:MAG TPA: PD-(D/E)XK nuclease family protein [Actinomycetes bacterium]|nr:PD-(D/E)XK nuclease family protein [Actinomycetes bacterium]
MVQVLIPDPPAPSRIDRISPSLYETLLGCPARAAWSAFGRRDALAPHPLALLGTCFHGVMEAVQKGQIAGSADECRFAARDCFDRLAASIHADAHPLLKVKFPSPEKLPFHNLFRERAAVLAGEYCGRPGEDAGSGSNGQGTVAEQRFTSEDGLIVGRPDLIDVPRSEVIDYKTGLAADEGWRVSEREARQLNLYVYLAGEAGLSISRGTIVRGNGETATIDIPRATAQAEAQKAREALAEYNASVDGRTFYDLARPAPDNCRMCPCLPMCEPFWRASDPTWQEDCGIHVEGTVVTVEPAMVQATPLVSLHVEATRGTLGQATVSVEQVPLAWPTADGDRAPEVGDVVRIVDARLTSPEDPVVVRADRIMTSLWRVETNRG